MAFDSTVGGPVANSYISVTAATAYFESNLNHNAWTIIAEPRKEILLMTATREINYYFDWIGIIATQTQALAWPRKSDDFSFDLDTIDNSDIGNGYQLDKNVLDGTTIPQMLLDAVCELALSLNSTVLNIGYSSIEELKVGPINVKFKSEFESGGFPKNIVEMLKRIGTNTIRKPGGFQMIKLER